MEEIGGTSEISNRVLEVILSNFPVARQRTINENDPLLDAGIIDSMGVLELVESIENVFEIEILEEELVAENFETITSLSKLIGSKLNGGISN